MIKISPAGYPCTRYPGRFLALLLLLMGLAVPLFAADYIPLAEVSRGMTGYGLTVFEGSRIDTFQVKVLGVQDRVRAAGSLIVVEVGGHGLEDSSIAQGMSGSPIFIDGRFAGALAFGWGGALRPLAGVTPAQEILALPTDIAHTLKPSSMTAAAHRSVAGTSMEPLIHPGDGQALAAAVMAEPGSPPEMTMARNRPDSGETPEELLLQLMDTDSKNPGSWFMSPVGFAQTGSAGATDKAAGSLQPGSSCAVPLITGDAQLGAIGTVTWVEGQDVYMMGHPFLQRGPVNLPLATAEILTIMPSRQLSFKLGYVGEIVGTVHHDQRAGLSGRLGPAPELIPVEVDLVLPTVTGEPGQAKNYNFGVVDDFQLTPTLVFWALFNSLLVEGDDASGQTITYRIELDWEGTDSLDGQPLILSGVSAGPGGVGRLATEWMAPISLLLNNSFAKVRLKGVKARLAVSRPVETAAITGITVPRLVAAPGQDLLCQIEVTPRLGSPEMIEIPVHLPAHLPDGNYRLAVANAAEMFALESQRAAGKFQVTSLNGMLDILRTERSAGTLVVTLLAPGSGMVLDGREMSGLPQRVSRVIRSGNMEAGRTLADIIARRDLPTGWLLQGHAVRNIKVASEAKPAKQERRP